MFISLRSWLAEFRISLVGSSMAVRLLFEGWDTVGIN